MKRFQINEILETTIFFELRNSRSIIDQFHYSKIMVSGIYKRYG